MDEKKQKTEEMIKKTADALGEGAKKLDQIVDKRSALGELSAPLTLGLVVMLVIAVINNTNLLFMGAIGVAIGFAPKIVKMVMEKKAELAAKKEEKKEEEKK